MTGHSRWRRRALVAMVALALFVLCVVLGFRNLGRWLVVSDPIDHAAAIVILAGELPFRGMEGAELFAQGWAPEVWLTEAAGIPEREAALARLGLRPGGSWAKANRDVLERLGVPPGGSGRCRDGCGTRPTRSRWASASCDASARTASSSSTPRLRAVASGQSGARWWSYAAGHRLISCERPVPRSALVATYRRRARGLQRNSGTDQRVDRLPGAS